MTSAPQDKWPDVIPLLLLLVDLDSTADSNTSPLTLRHLFVSDFRPTLSKHVRPKYILSISIKKN